MRDTAILGRFAKLCGRDDARIVVIPTASRLESTGRKYEELFEGMGVRKVRVLALEERADCSDADALETLLVDAVATGEVPGLQALVADTVTELKKLTPESVDALSGKEIVFEFGEIELPFAAEDFILSFALPNFYFHAVTAYDILRMRGVPLGKADFMGPIRFKR